MIAIDGLTVQLGGVRPLSELTVDLDAPLHGVIGPNGAGKTTLLNVLSGFVREASGSIVADGVELHGLSPRRRATWGLRRTFQTECLATQITARANVMVAADTTLPRGRRRSSVDRALEFAGVAEPDVPASAVDGFQRRLVEIARCLVGEPRIVLLDEPGGGLAGAETTALGDLLRAIPGEFGAQVVLVDHDVDLIASVCARTTVLDFGELLASGPTSDVLEDERVRAAWLGTAEVV